MATLPASLRSTSYPIVVSGAGPYAIGFRLFDTDNLDVFINGVRSTAFTVSATFANGYDDNATITFTSSVTAPATILIEGAMVPDRDAEYISGQGNLAPALNIELPRLWAVVQELRRQVRRAVRGFAEIDPASGVDANAIANASTYATAASASASAAAASAASAAAASNSLLRWKGPWVTATAYSPNDIVQESGNSYACVVSHTSGTFATDLAAVKWQILAAKGSAGAGTGDMLAANNLSDVSNVGTARANLAVCGALSTAETSQDALARAALNPRGMWFVAGTGMTNIPTGGAANDIFFSKGLDANNVTVVWFRADGQIFTNNRTGGTWGGWIQHATKAYVDSLFGGVLVVRDEQTSGTNGGASTTSYTTRTLNQVKTNTISGASLASNQITLPAGTYTIEATAPGVRVGRHKAKLYSVTDGADVIIGSSAHANAGGDYEADSIIRGSFTIAGSKVFEIRHRAASIVSYGWGISTGFGDVEVYTQVMIRKIA